MFLRFEHDCLGGDRPIIAFLEKPPMVVASKRWGVLHVIWRQGFCPGIGAPSWTADYGNETANHFDHVHIATANGGYPTGDETYHIGSMSPCPDN